MSRSVCRVLSQSVSRNKVTTKNQGILDVLTIRSGALTPGEPLTHDTRPTGTFLDFCLLSMKRNYGDPFRVRFLLPSLVRVTGDPSLLPLRTRV